MAFDAQRYDREVIRPLRSFHGRLPVGDEWARYAVEPQFTATDLAAHLELVRAHWRALAAGSSADGRVRVARLLLASDEEISRSVGQEMHDMAWWLARSPHQPVETSPVDLPSPEAAPMPASSSWQAEARDYIAGHLWPDHRTERAVSNPDVAPAPSAQTLAPLEITVRLLDVVGEVGRVAISWAAPARGEVHIRRFSEPPEWEVGDVLPTSAIVGQGDLITVISRTIGAERTEVTAEVPVDYHVYQPLLVHEATTTVGRFVGFGVCEPARRLTVDRRGDQAVLTWTWPAGAIAAQVQWASAAGAHSRRVTKADFVQNGGLDIPIVGGEDVAHVQMITVFNGLEVFSAERSIRLPASKIAVRYTLGRARLRPNQITIRLTGDQDCTFDLEFVVSAGDAMPLPGGRNPICASFPAVRLRRDNTVVLEARLPQNLTAPFWMRCFVSASDSVVLLDPPVNTLKVT